MAAPPVGLARQALGNAPHCGDDGAWWRRGPVLTLCLVDGLGHGEDAAHAARLALDFVAAHVGEPLTDVVAACDTALRGSRGVVLALAAVDGAGAMSFVGVGNIQAVVHHERSVHLPSVPGIVGAGHRKLSVERATLLPKGLFVMYTDGLKTVIDLSRHQHLLRESPETLARAILRDWSRGTDDAAVMVHRKEA